MYQERDEEEESPRRAERKLKYWSELTWMFGESDNEAGLLPVLVEGVTDESAEIGEEVEEGPGNYCVIPEEPVGSLEKVVEKARNIILLKRLETCDSEEFGFSSIVQYEVEWMPEVENDEVRRELLAQFVDTLGKYFLLSHNTVFVRRNPLLTDQMTLRGFNPPRVGNDISLIFRRVHSDKRISHRAFFRLLFQQIYHQMARKVLATSPRGIATVLLKCASKRLEVWPGVVVDVEETGEGVKIILDASLDTLFSDYVGNWFEILQKPEVGRGTPNPVSSREESKFGKVALPEKYYSMKFLDGETIKIIGSTKRLYEIGAVEFGRTPVTQINEKRSGESAKKNLVELCRERKVNLSDWTQPLIFATHHNKRRKVRETCYLIPELCQFVREGRSDDEEQKKVEKEVSTMVPVTEKVRWDGLTKFVRTLKTSEGFAFILAAFNLKIDTPKRVVPEDAA